MTKSSLALSSLRALACFGAIALGVSGVRAASLAHRSPAVAVAVPVPVSDLSPPKSGTETDTATGDEDGVAKEIRIAVARAAMADGDAPGTDSKNAARPTGSTRIFEGPLDARGSIVRIYTTKTDAAVVLGDLASGLQANGFANSGAANEPGTISMRRANAFVVARATTREDRTILSIVEFGFESVAGERQE